ncbi:MAG: tripartite tricarboxylate transporter substrate binding protein [Deltaproteobacteria bacterium]|nr:tripartite tricarboxylate transporter substrate binding protein [Deltaproteobacteria bacterium]
MKHRSISFKCRWMMKGKPFWTILLGVLLAPFLIDSLWSQDKPRNYPTRDIEVVVQYPVGGGSDIFVRSLMMPARKYLKVNIHITNLPGGGGFRASNYVLSFPADGYTIYTFNPEQIINTIFGREDYRKFAPLCNVQQDQSMLYVRGESPFKTIQDLIRYAKENPGKLRFTGTSAGSPDEVIVMLFSKRAGIKVKYTPFDAASETHAAVLAGQVEVLHEEPGVIMSLIESNKLKPLIVFTEKRLEAFPNVPTARELGYDITMGRWRGLSVKKGTSQKIIHYLAEVFKKCTGDPSYKTIAHANLLDLHPGWKDPEEYGKFWDEEYSRYYEIFKELGYLEKPKK